MPRVYIRIESARGRKSAATPADEAACLSVANKLAKALNLDAPGGERGRKSASLVGVTLRLDAE